VSSDVDKTNGYDTLSYEWRFSEDGKTQVVNASATNDQVKVQFNALGKHQIKLTVKDDYGKIAEIEKDIEIKSILRPEAFIVPIATSWGNPVNFVVKSNLPLINYVGISVMEIQELSSLIRLHIRINKLMPIK